MGSKISTIGFGIMLYAIGWMIDEMVFGDNMPLYTIFIVILALGWWLVAAGVWTDCVKKDNNNKDRDENNN
jgi:F0F1-type ATP synthase assembly protein I